MCLEASETSKVNGHIGKVMAHHAEVFESSRGVVDCHVGAHAASEGIRLLIPVRPVGTDESKACLDVARISYFHLLMMARWLVDIGNGRRERMTDKEGGALIKMGVRLSDDVFETSLKVARDTSFRLMDGNC